MKVFDTHKSFIGMLFLYHMDYVLFLLVAIYINLNSNNGHHFALKIYSLSLPELGVPFPLYNFQMIVEVQEYSLGLVSMQSIMHCQC